MYRIPTFNLLCNLYVGNGVGVFPATPGGPIRISNLPCALVYGRRVNVASTGGTASPGIPLQMMNLLTPKGTDIRGLQDDTTGPDVVEVPAGSTRWYTVAYVDDIGKGWLNEHRTAIILAIEKKWTPPYA